MDPSAPRSTPPFPRSAAGETTAHGPLARRAGALSLAVSLAAVVLAVGATRAEAEVYFDVRTLLTQHFQRSERVAFVRVVPSAAERAAIEQRTGRRLARASYNVFVARTASRIDGYAIVDEEIGQHEPIRFAVFFDANGQVTRHEIVEYREAYGGEVRHDRFRRQFVGRGVGSTFRLGDDIDSVSGATLSARSMCAGVQRAVMLVDIARRQTPSAASASRTASR